MKIESLVGFSSSCWAIAVILLLEAIRLPDKFQYLQHSLIEQSQNFGGYGAENAILSRIQSGVRAIDLWDSIQKSKFVYKY
jgi:hypothetical protein